MKSFDKTHSLHQLSLNIVQCINALDFPERTEQEITELGKRASLDTLKDPRLFVQWAFDNRVSRTDAYSIIAWSNSIKDFLYGVDADGSTIFGDVYSAYNLAQTNSIILHRVNYLLHQQMIIVYDLLENDKRFKFMVKKNYIQAEKLWEMYERPRQKGMDLTAWSVLQDHLRLAADTLRPRLQHVYETARDRMIYLGMKDIQLRSRIVVALTVGKMQHHSFNHFFDDFKRDTNCDFRRLFQKDDLTPMTRCFADMVQALGMNIKNDQYGMPSLSDFDIDQSVRAGWAWSSFMRDLRDVDLMDDAARRAIDLNPKVRQEYYEVLRQEDEKRDKQKLEKSVKRLEKKFKVSKL